MRIPNPFDAVIPGRSRGGLKAWRGAVAGMSRAHRHHDVELNAVAHGWVEYLIAGRRIRLAAGDTALFWAAMPHRLIASASDTQMGWLVAPADWTLHLLGGSPHAAALLRGRVLVDHDAAADDCAALARWEAALAHRDPTWDRIVELEAEARLRTMALRGTLARTTRGGGTPHVSAASAKGLRAVEQMARVMAGRYDEPISVADIADGTGMHPNAAMRLFRKHVGMTLIDYLTRLRVAEAQRLLMTTGDDVLSIGLACGFGSASRFHQAFRACVGTTPARYRKQHDAD